MGHKEELGPKLYLERWIMLFYLSMANFLSDWICFSIAPVMNIAEEAFVGLHPSALVSVFLAFNVISSILEPPIVQRIGLRNAMVLGCVIMFLGCLIKSGIPGLWSASYGSLLLGTVFVGIAQPFFQCTPALLAANWFGSNERTLATTIALNANQFGIAASYMLGTNLVKTPVELQDYFYVISIVSAVLVVGVVIQFKEKPPTPPSFSAQGKMAQEYEASLWGWLDDMFGLFKANGFMHTVVSFTASIAISNMISTFLASMLSPQGHDQVFIGVIGAVFQVMIMMGSLVIGYGVDRYKAYWSATVFCFACSCLWLFTLSISLNRQLSALTLVSVVSIGFFVGPIQPIAAETACEITYPSDENTIVAVQQVFGNLFSAILVPFFHALRDPYTMQYAGSINMVFMTAVASMVVFASFRPDLKRSNLDKSGGAEDNFLLKKKDDISSSQSTRPLLLMDSAMMP
uniref:Major facilitator superfamily (MFS) profile domain-containing protein n=1 Tax=Heterosigma akashiwo TaxID=2829 RepID=A0A6S9EIL0_HETAK|mmetsp:Transcript_1731/g.2985  ORF Transcript_1731/g.2985 Transcript_1731/m.2985 type:complete len:460 (+) Transcript_1731:225-1604(+)